MTATHTPTPRYTEAPWHTANAKVNIYDQYGDVIGNFRHAEDTSFAIVACNAHDALVAIAEQQAALHCSGTDENNDTCGVTYTCPNCQLSRVAAAALKLAKGEA